MIPCIGQLNIIYSVQAFRSSGRLHRTLVLLHHYHHIFPISTHHTDWKKPLLANASAHGNVTQKLTANFINSPFSITTKKLLVGFHLSSEIDDTWFFFHSLHSWKGTNQSDWHTHPWDIEITLLGCSNIHIMKMGQWPRASFKEDLHEQMVFFSQGMSYKPFKYFKITSSTYNTLTIKLLGLTEDVSTQILTDAQNDACTMQDCHITINIIDIGIYNTICSFLPSLCTHTVSSNPLIILFPCTLTRGGPRYNEANLSRVCTLKFFNLTKNWSMSKIGCSC